MAWLMKGLLSSADKWQLEGLGHLRKQQLCLKRSEAGNNECGETWLQVAARPPHLSRLRCSQPSPGCATHGTLSLSLSRRRPSVTSPEFHSSPSGPNLLAPSRPSTLPPNVKVPQDSPLSASPPAE